MERKTIAEQLRIMALVLLIVAGVGTLGLLFTWENYTLLGWLVSVVSLWLGLGWMAMLANGLAELLSPNTTGKPAQHWSGQ